MSGPEEMQPRAPQGDMEMKILFCGLDYHTYTRSIIAEMELLGATVRYVDIQPRGFGCQVLRITSPQAYSKYRDRIHQEAIRESEAIAYDQVVFLQAHQINLENLSRLREQQRKAQFTLYNWDSLAIHDYRAQARLFDRVLTFDQQDAQGNQFGYLPLFCQRSMQSLRRGLALPRTTYMVGNISKIQRYKAVEVFRDYCRNTGIEFRQHLKVTPVVWSQLVRAGIWPKTISFRSISTAGFNEMIEASAAVFDFANHTQTGMTMRLMESLCAGKKILTNNKWVKQEPFYSPDRIHVFDELNFDGVDDFLRKPLAEPDADFSEYHVQHFTRQLLGMAPLSPVQPMICNQ